MLLLFSIFVFVLLGLLVLGVGCGICFISSLIIAFIFTSHGSIFQNFEQKLILVKNLGLSSK